MTFYELFYRMIYRFEHPLYQQISAVLKQYLLLNPGNDHGIKQKRIKKKVLDVGGRTSSYTIGLNADIVVSELPRQSKVQKMKQLGVNREIIKKITTRRSNIISYVFDDMTRSKFSSNEFDIIVAVEVIEHVLEDHAFLRQVKRVLTENGLFLLTTPNGDYVPNRNPDHKRHYGKRELQMLLEKYFNNVTIVYAVLDTRNFKLGQYKWSLKHPIETVLSFYGFSRAKIESRDPVVAQKKSGTLHLVALCNE